MRICVLQSTGTEVINHYRADPSPWLADHTCEHHVIAKATAGEQVAALVRRGGFDVFINLCDGVWDEDSAGVEVLEVLQRMRVPFTGANTLRYDPSREAMKLVAAASGVDYPVWCLARDLEEAAAAAERLRFPLIVKHPNSYASVGMTRDDRVEDRAALLARTSRWLEVYGGALIEEFIAGREFAVLVAEDPDVPSRPVAFTPLEIFFAPGESFKHYDLKWVDYATKMSCGPVTEPVLAERLRELGRRMIGGFPGSGYLRCDVRMDGEGRLFMLEINANCGLFHQPSEFTTADWILHHDPLGHRGFLDLIIAHALRRVREPAVRLAESATPGRLGSYAARDLAAGEVILAGEERPVRLVSRRHAERVWDEARRRRLRAGDSFAAGGRPLTDELWAMWSDDPEEWRPIAHACDPNAWLDGLDVVARRAIARGEPITLDYATLHADELEPFSCHCGAAQCRDLIRGSDYRLPDLVARYGEHVSEYVRHKRRAAR